MQFIESAGASRGASCFLCEKPAEPRERDRDNLVLYRGERVFVVLNLYPYNSGHLMVAPYQHTGDFATLDPDTAVELILLSQRCVAALQQAYQPDAFNTGMNLGQTAGAGVPDHLHFHLVPRWSGDTNFMPVIGQAKVVPESLDRTYDRLAPFFMAE
jgi:ATP adenylyltransferase